MATRAMPGNSFHAKLDTPVGPMLLCTDGRFLTGLYFIDQQDCPNVQGLPAYTPSLHKPSYGMHQGKEIRRLRVQQNDSLPLAFDNCGDDKSVVPEASDTRSNHMSDRAFKLDFLTLAPHELPVPAVDLLQQAGAELQRYFAGSLREFSVPVSMAGSEFQQAVWQALLGIPYGCYVSYGDIATQLGRPAAYARAIGTAVGANPISVIVPCHRVVSATRAMTGYTGGLARKLALLELEGIKIA